MSHHHGHQHHETIGKAFKYGIALNLLYIIVEAGFGFLNGSMALLADAGHNLSDVLGLALAWGATVLMTFRPTKSRTYGFRKTSILAALFNAIILLVAVGAIGVESVRRLFHPEPVGGGAMIIVAAIGVVINALTALLFFRDKEHDLNIKGAYLHMAADAGVSVGVVLAGILISYTGMYWIDPVISLAIMIIIVWGTWGLLRDSGNMAIDSVPPQINPEQVEAYLKTVPGVLNVHDLHIWAMSTTETALTVHLIKNSERIVNDETENITHHLEHEFGIGHVTIQYETELKNHDCTNHNGCC
jgi:cobalt-zinc-cadmium efflux system protein